MMHSSPSLLHVMIVGRIDAIANGMSTPRVAGVGNALLITVEITKLYSGDHNIVPRVFPHIHRVAGVVKGKKYNRSFLNNPQQHGSIIPGHRLDPRMNNFTFSKSDFRQRSKTFKKRLRLSLQKWPHRHTYFSVFKTQYRSRAYSMKIPYACAHTVQREASH